jgi:4a-hydroxytetrahydrobiopterin dehydratase
MLVKKLNDAEVKAALATRQGWDYLPAKPAITKKFKFRDFQCAWNFMDDVAGYADENSHHPEWTNIYNRVEITLTTHDAGGVTDLDFDLADFIDEAAARYEQRAV